jgi:hypothetical protein
MLSTGKEASRAFISVVLSNAPARAGPAARPALGGGARGRRQWMKALKILMVTSSTATIR